MTLQDFINHVSTQCGNVKYIPPINEEQFNQVVLLVKKSNAIKKKMVTPDKNSFKSISNFLLVEECSKAFKVGKFDIWFIIRELQIIID